MNKKILIIVGVVLVIAIIGVAIAFNKILKKKIIHLYWEWMIVFHQWGTETKITN